MVRKSVMSFIDTDLRIRPEVQVTPEHEGDNARQIRLEGKPLQFVHQPHVLVKTFWYTLWTIQRWQFRPGPALHALNASFHLANRVDIIGHLHAVDGTESSFQAPQILQD